MPRPMPRNRKSSASELQPPPRPRGSGRPARRQRPRHVAIIMDGNGRWASARGLPRVAGHRAGAEAVRKTLRAAVEAGVECLTLYAFSSENWRRSEEEVSDLKGLLGYYLERELDELAKEGVRLKLIGDHRAFGRSCRSARRAAVEAPRRQRRLTWSSRSITVARRNRRRARESSPQGAAGEIDPRRSTKTRGGA